VTGSGHQVKKHLGRIGSRVKGSGLVPSLDVAELYIRCTCIVEMAPHLPMQKSKIKKEIVASTYVMISRNVHIYAWLREAY